jgi:molybdopterin converting factor subunit 1
MIVHVLAFGIAKEIFESPAADIELNNAATVSRLKIVLEKKYPALKKLGSYMIAVNNEYAAEQTIIDAKDEIAVIPPVSGG